MSSHLQGSEEPAELERARSHHCHAFGCKALVPPRRLMCLRHWRLVPRALQEAVWESYRPGQERRMDPSHAYLLAAAAAVRAVARKEGHPPATVESDASVAGYVSWLRLTAPCGDDACPCREPAPNTLFA
ncbi:MAG TPA: hypothetical protein VHD87_14925 [Acidimicrobiales bacterium]|nr:hypothetical protein [Acidimicrobiales bacterium]